MSRNNLTQSLSSQSRNFWKDRSDADWRRDEHWVERYAAELLSFLPKGGILLDVGCGDGDCFPYFVQHYRQIIGIDFSERMLAAAQEKIRRLNLSNVILSASDSTHFPEQIKNVDAILSSGLVQYLDSEELFRHLGECHRVLNRDGVVLLGAIPSSSRRLLFYSGALSGPLPPLPHLLRHFWDAWRRYRHARKQGDLLWDGIGRWFTAAEIRDIAAAVGFKASFSKALCFKYRFHAVLRGSDGRSW